MPDWPQSGKGKVLEGKEERKCPTCKNLTCKDPSDRDNTHGELPQSEEEPRVIFTSFPKNRVNENRGDGREKKSISTQIEA